MAILPLLQKNKGTVSSALSKRLAEKALAGDRGILSEALELMTYEKEELQAKTVRSAAAKIVELVAQARPELVAPCLNFVFPALEAGEPQTRWMAIRIFGFCAALVPAAAVRAIPWAEKFIRSAEGLCLKSSADLFLGDIGALSPARAGTVFPILERSAGALVRNEEDWILEAYLKIWPNLNPPARKKVIAFAKGYADAARGTTRARAKKILKAAACD